MPKPFLSAQLRERDRILAELARIKGVMPLLMKPRNGMRWTSGERRELAVRFRAIARLSPYLAVMILPGSFVFLPLLAWWLDRRRHRRADSADAGAMLHQARSRGVPGVGSGGQGDHKHFSN